MKRNIILKGKSIDYLLKKSSRAKNLRLAIYCDGSLVVTMPQGLFWGRAERFLREKAGWIIDKMDKSRKNPRNPLLQKYSKREYKKLKNDAYKLAEQKVKQYNQIYQLKYNRISIRNQKTRWGSCSSKGNISYNYKIIFLPEKLADYIIVHELCHLKEFNHSKRFWDLVSIAFPDWKKIRNELRKM